MPRLRAPGSSIVNYVTGQLRSKASNSISAVQDTFFYAKDMFERHKVVFTISTSIASVATAWAGYTLRQLHQSRVEQRLESIEKAMQSKSNNQMDDPELRKIVSRTVSVPACVATAGTSLIIGYALGCRSGAWYANRKFRKEQMKLLGQMKPQRGLLRFLRRPRTRPRLQESPSKTPESSQIDASLARSSTQIDPVHG